MWRCSSYSVKKKSKAQERDKTFLMLASFRSNELADEQYEAWTDELMDAADNVGSTTSLVQSSWDAAAIADS